MANEDNKKQAQSKDQQNPLVILFGLLFGVLILQQIITRLNDFITNLDQISLYAYLEGLYFSVLPFLHFFAVVFSVILLVIIRSINKKTGAIRRKEKEEIYPNLKKEKQDSFFTLPGGSEGLPSDFENNPRWRTVKELIDSDIEADWRQAILEADIMLGEMLENMGYRGESVGERLRQIDKNKFKTINQAWEAHKARNLIAHEGSSYIISEREGRRIIDLYQQVFQEFHYI